jgi:hypothetical protein
LFFQFFLAGNFSVQSKSESFHILGKNLPSAQTSGSRLTENGNKDGALITLGNKIYEMKHTHSSGGREWVRIKPDLKIARTYHLFFSVPLSATGC